MPLEKIIIAAVADNGVIGRDNALPWDLPEDRRRFRELTTGHSVLMGRRTFAAIGRPLPERHNLVLSRTLEPQPGITVCRSFAAALREAEKLNRTLFFAGGADIYRRSLLLADRMLLSRVHGAFSGDAYFPPFDQNEWTLERVEPHAGFDLEVYRRSR